MQMLYAYASVRVIEGVNNESHVTTKFSKSFKLTKLCNKLLASCLNCYFPRSVLNSNVFDVLHDSGFNNTT
jgi:hypothetical protein